MNNYRSLLDLPLEIILQIREELGGKSEAQLGMTCSYLNQEFKKYKKPIKTFTIQKNINYLTLQQLSTLTFEDRYYKPAFINHIMNYTTELQTIKFTKRNSWSFKYSKNFFNTSFYKKLTYVVPPTAYAKFQTMRGKKHLNITLKKSSA